MSARVVDLATGKRYTPKKLPKGKARPVMSAEEEERMMERRAVERMLDRAIEDYRFVIEFLSDPSNRARMSYAGAKWEENGAGSARRWCENGYHFTR